MDARSRSCRHALERVCQDLPWMDHVPWGKGKGKKGWRKAKGWHQEEHRTEELSASTEDECRARHGDQTCCVYAYRLADAQMELGSRKSSPPCASCGSEVTRLLCFKESSLKCLR